MCTNKENVERVLFASVLGKVILTASVDVKDEKIIFGDDNAMRKIPYIKEWLEAKEREVGGKIIGIALDESKVYLLVATREEIFVKSAERRDTPFVNLMSTIKSANELEELLNFTEILRADVVCKVFTCRCANYEYGITPVMTVGGVLLEGINSLVSVLYNLMPSLNAAVFKFLYEKAGGIEKEIVYTGDVALYYLYKLFNACGTNILIMSIIGATYFG